MSQLALSFRQHGGSWQQISNHQEREAVTKKWLVVYHLALSVDWNDMLPMKDIRPLANSVGCR